MNSMTLQQRSFSLYLTSIFLLVIMLCSAFSHSHELSFDAEHAVEQLDCKLCHLKVDTPKQSIQPAKITLGVFSLEKIAIVKCTPEIAQYRYSNPRAPPYFI